MINGYGPQEDEEFNKITHFWQNIESEIIKCQDEGCYILLELDANAKVGKEVIKCDPNKLSNNGKILLEILERHNLFIANANEKCKGLITRKRICNGIIEESILDYVILCDRLNDTLNEMVIDDDQTYTLQHCPNKNKAHHIKSDHNVLFVKFQSSFSARPKPVRHEFFNFKSEESRRAFQLETSISQSLS